MMIKVRNGKGGKDRYTLLGKTVLADLRKYYAEYSPKVYLFEGAGGGQYSSTSIRKIVVRAASDAGIAKKVTPHMLRHSFATAAADRAFAGEWHLLEVYTNLAWSYQP